MDIVNCQQCSKPFIKKGGVRVCSGCLDEERGMYDFYYQKITPRLRELNFRYIARQTSLDEKRLEQALEYRLGGDESGDVSLKRSVCNVCGKRQDNLESPEPICVKCLDLVLKLIERDERAFINAEQRDERVVLGPPEVDVLQYPASQGRMTHISPAQCLGETVSRALYEEALQKLAMYEESFGPLPSVGGAENADDSTLRSLLSSSKESEEVLMILDQKDEEIVLNKDEMQTLNTAHLYLKENKRRHYGFKRIEQT